MLYFIGIGPSLKYLSLKAIEILGIVDKIIVDTYTSIIPDFTIDNLLDIIGVRDLNKIVLAKRSDLEGKSISCIVEEAKYMDIAILVPGDPFIATTHDAIRLHALENNVPVKVVYNVSIYSLAASATGLQAYKFGKTVTLVYPEEFTPISTLEAIYHNLIQGLHTLVLLDIRAEEQRIMNIREAVSIIIELENKVVGHSILENVLAVGVARLGTDEEYIRADKLSNLAKYEYPPPPHSIVIVGYPHPIELELLKHLGHMSKETYEYFLQKNVYQEIIKNVNKALKEIERI